VANLILTSGGQTLLRDYLAAPRNDLAPQTPQYISIGSGAAAATRFMTAMPNETFRGQIMDRAVDGLSVTFSTFLTTSENIGKTGGNMVGFYGLMAGKATADLGTGILVAIANEASPFWKDGSQEVSVDLVVTVSGTIS